MPIYEIKVTLTARVISATPEQAAADAITQEIYGTRKNNVQSGRVEISHRELGPSSDEILEAGRKQLKESNAADTTKDG